MTRPVSVVFYSGFAIIFLGILSPLILHVFKPAPALPVLGTVPVFSGVDSTGKTFTSQELSEKFWVATFFFTHCESTCPKQNLVIGRLAYEFRNQPHVKFLSITVTPEQDSPEVLAGYAEKLGADPKAWSFLRLPQPELDRLLQGIHLGKPGEPAAHSTRLVLVDNQGQIRGYFDALEPNIASEMIGRIRRLIW